MTVQRRDFFPPSEILKEIKHAVAGDAELDFLTFVGEGEPTLCRSIGWLIRKTKEITDIPIAVDTNGSLLHLPELREELSGAEVVMPSLDAGTAETFRRINRPHRALDFDTIVAGMEKFRQVYRGEIWMEVMLVKGLNDSESELEAIKRILERIEPDRTYLNVPIRPPAEAWVMPPDEEAIAMAHDILSASAAGINVVEITTGESGEFSTSGFTNPEEAILAIIRRHPMREEQIVETLRKQFRYRAPRGAVEMDREVEASMKRLERSGKVKRERYRDKTFWVIAAERRGKKE